jgi:hypothetical protein
MVTIDIRDWPIPKFAESAWLFTPPQSHWQLVKWLRQTLAARPAGMLEIGVSQAS